MSIYDGTTNVVSHVEPHLGGNIKEGDPYTFCPRVWNYVIERFAVTSMMDLGSGIGHAAHYFFTNRIKTIAIDGLVENVAGSLYPAICHDLTKGPIVTNVDLVHCQEVAEHIEERYLDHLLSSLACGRVILMTAALPGQGGHHHVNLQPMDYWVDHLRARGYDLLTEDTNRIRSIAAQEGAQYMQNSGLLLHRKSLRRDSEVFTAKSGGERKTAELQAMSAQLERTSAELQTIRGSRTYKLAVMMRRMAFFRKLPGRSIS